MNYLKAIFYVSITLFSFSAIAQSPQLVKLWETDSTLKTPESVLYHAEGKVLYVSNIDGKSNEKDLKGSISKISLEGKIIDPTWAINLSAPKGMGIFANKLYVADINEVVIIDLKTGKALQRIPIPGAIFLNDITIDKAGIVYISDSASGKVHRLEGTTVTAYLENKTDVNGLLASGEYVYLAVKDTLYRADRNKILTKIATGMDESTDGIAQIGNNFIVSCWNGIIYYVKPDGSKITLLDTRAKKINTADVGFDPVTKTLYVPTFFKNKVVAYQVRD
jgi:sugar lactone lactonase YvrE